MDFVLRSIQAGRYTGTAFHRVVPAFVAQGGDPRGDGYGGTSELIPTEVGPGRFERGTVGIALGGLDTGGMQFFIMTADSPHLDGRYPWIGRVLEGMDLVDSWLPGEQLTRVTVE
jgi:cyclophilin family peptidyl-prolyl cis-trans isomerase